MLDFCICYTADSNYLFPTLASAMQARKHTPINVADVIVVSIDASDEQNKIFSRVAALEGLHLIPISLKHLDGADAMLARLFLDRIIPDNYEQFLYIDGDTQIIGSLVTLINVVVPAGRFCAVRDPMTFSLDCGRSGTSLTNYFNALGIDRARHSKYFNSGVLRINRTGWDGIGREAWSLFQALKGRSSFPDQDALNLVAMDRAIPVSLRWNFPVFLRNAGLQDVILPKIIHYMSRPKPWHGRFLPWGLAEYEGYLDIQRRYPELIPYASRMSIPRRLKYKLQQHYKKIEEFKAWGSGCRYDAIMRYEENVNLAGVSFARGEGGAAISATDLTI
jgi:lipopolysaccharide biosynthesis glycosyltransferase